MSHDVHTPAAEAPKARRAAGAFDIRNVIAALLGIYGIVLLICAFVLEPGVNPDTNLVKNASDNLWAGGAMLATAIIFVIWAKVNPIVVEAE